jgi:hypothetical protein
MDSTTVVTRVTTRKIEHSDENAPDAPWCMVGAGVLLALALWSVTWGLGDLRATTARTFSANLARYNEVRDPTLWARAHAGLNFARHVNPLNADYGASLGRLHQWQAWQQLRKTDARAYRHGALVTYRQTVSRRPTWAVAWMELAEAGALSVGMTPEVTNAFHRAAQLGPWERSVQRKTVWLGLAGWSRLAATERELVRNTVHRALLIDNDLKGMLVLARQYQWLDEFERIRTEVETASASKG